MKIPMYQVDAFTDKIFGGNPAAVCPLKEWPETAVMQNIAMENNLSETAFYIPDGDGFAIRWFTPELEMDLAGHPTLATAHVLFHHEGYEGKKIRFQSASGELVVVREGDRYVMNFPARPPQVMEAPGNLIEGLGKKPLGVYKSRDILVHYASEEEILGLKPDFGKLALLDCLGIIVTAEGKESDFVSRFFAPHAGINEDPVTGSAHATLIPFWAERLDKSVLHAFQVSKRRGELFCEYLGDRVKIGGRAVTFFTGTIEF